MNANGDDDERMVELVTMLAVAGQVLAALAVELASATANEVPELAADAKVLMERIVACCVETSPLEHLTQEHAATLRAELLKLGEALEAQIAGIIDIRWTQLTGGGSSSTRH